MFDKLRQTSTIGFAILLWVKRMEDYISRLIACGFSEDNAKAIYKAYKSKNDKIGLIQFIANAEKLYKEDD